MLAEESWRHYTENLDVGRKIRVNHDCGVGRTLIVSRDARGYTAHCFRCGESGGFSGPPRPLAERLAELAQRAQEDAIHASVLSLPEPAVHGVDGWPDHARLWLLRAGIGRVETAQLGAYYHPPTDRVVLPILEAGVPIFWQARALDKRQPKYLAPPVDRSRVIPRHHAVSWGATEREEGVSPERSITLTEDILSAFKVGLVAEGWSLLGTSLGDYHVAQLLDRNVPVNVWLDDDRGGKRGATKAVARLRSVGLEVRRIVTPMDPKRYSTQQIKEILCC